MDRTLPDSATQDDQSRDMLAAAHRRVEEILARKDLYEADPDQRQAIDEVVRAAERELTALPA